MSDISPTILVVDDDEFTAEFNAAILEMAGYETFIAVGGLEALEKMAGTPEIRVVVSDMNMPFIDGLQLFAELRQQGFNQPFVLLTGDAAAPLRSAHPELDAVMAKDEQLPESLPEIIGSLLARTSP